MKKYIKVFVFFVVMALLFGCKKSTTTTANTTTKTLITTTGKTTTEATTTRNEFYIHFDNYDGKPLESYVVNRGETPEYNGITPTRPTDNKYEYTFSGWDKELVPATDDVIYKATYSTKPVNHTLTYDLNGGEMEEVNPSKFNVESGKFPLYTPTREGYEFNGWDVYGENDTRLWAPDNIFNSEMILDHVFGENLLVKASWKPCKYNVTIEMSHSAAGRVSGAGTYETGQKVSLYVSVYSGYEFDGFYVDYKKLDDNYFYMPGHDVKVMAWFIPSSDPEHCSIYLYSNIEAGGTVTGGSWQAIGSNTTIEAIPNSGYIFENWTDKKLGTVFSTEAKVTFEVVEDRYLVANFRAINNKVTITNNVSNLEYSGIVSGNVYAKDTSLKLTFPNIPSGKLVKMSVNGHTIVGLSYSFTMAMDEVNIIIKELIDIPYTKIDDTTYLFGNYPQVLVDEDIIISDLSAFVKTPIIVDVDGINCVQEGTNYYLIEDDERILIDNYELLDNGKLFVAYYFNKASDYLGSYDMWYLDLDINDDGFYDYRAVYFTDYNKSKTDVQNGYDTTIVYYFKYEPIKWNVINNNNGKLLLVADILLDCQYFYPSTSDDEFEHNGGVGYANNYELSHIRKWLNNEFYKVAFYGYSNVLSEVLIINDKSTVSYSDINEFACNDTFDKISLLSYQEVNSYMTTDSRLGYSTDYAKARGLYVYSSTSSFWFLRSPRQSDASRSNIVGNDGGIYDTSDTQANGVRPAIYLYV